MLLPDRFQLTQSEQKTILVDGIDRYAHNHTRGLINKWLAINDDFRGMGIYKKGWKCSVRDVCKGNVRARARARARLNEVTKEKKERF